MCHHSKVWRKRAKILKKICTLKIFGGLHCGQATQLEQGSVKACSASSDGQQGCSCVGGMGACHIMVAIEPPGCLRREGQTKAIEQGINEWSGFPLWPVREGKVVPGSA